MKNESIITYLKQFNPELKVSITASIQYGCLEKGFGRGEWQGHEFTQDYTVTWNEGHLCATEYDGITVGDVMKVLSKKSLSDISNKDFNLCPGELMNGYTEYDTTWVNDTPEEIPSDSELYSIMNFGDTEYEWENASSIDFEIHYVEPDGSDSTLLFVLSKEC